MSQSVLACCLLILLLGGCGRGPRQLPPPTAGGSSTPSTDSRTVDPTSPRPELEFRIEPGRIQPGDSALLTWETRHADRVVIEPAIGEVDLSGRIKFFPEATSSYTISASGPGGEVSESVTVIVEGGGSRGPDDLREEDLRGSGSLEEEFKVSVKPIFFGFDSAELTEKARLTLDGNIRWLSRPENRHIEFVLEGHADSRGSEEYNFALADQRARVVLEYLAEHGIEGPRMTALSLGEERPFDTRETEEAFALNRRTHFVMLPSP